MTIRMKAIELLSCGSVYAVLFIMLYKVVPTSKSVD